METVPLDIQIMEPDHLPFNKDELASNGNRIFAGIEEDLIDRRVAYHLYPHHPSDPLLSHQFDGQTHRVPASEVMHLFMETRPGERRGVPVFATALNALDTLGVYDYAELERKKGAAMYGGYYRKPLDAQGEVPEAFGAIADGEDVAIQPLEPNSWIELPVGYEVEHSTPPPSDPNGDKFRRAMLASIAASLHMTYEHLTWDFEKLGDRQYRAAMLEFVRIVEMYQWHLMIEMFCKPIWKRFVSRAILEGLWTPPENAQRRDYMRCEWTPPARGYIHPVQDIQAYAEAIRAGITSRKRVAGQLGEDVRRIDLENAADQAHADKLKLRYSTYVAQDADQFGPNFGSSASDALEATVQAEADDEVDRFSEEGTA